MQEQIVRALELLIEALKTINFASSRLLIIEIINELGQSAVIE
jgi:hypothetical protein